MKSTIAKDVLEGKVVTTAIEWKFHDEDMFHFTNIKILKLLFKY